ncbi:FecR family protein [Desulfobotulus mexicanus]|uniref:FecR domain-containing protein n=1 Tax=Desulfobotulus mexicanus TaxID=2586642 RepID=A0A5Q4VD12_9BACT|nr:FecR family protein [Desulfobotulus mexicanus]TYT75589.1 FecR domain-containing protein [Desulfobotulus mexicanus]
MLLPSARSYAFLLCIFLSFFIFSSASAQGNTPQKPSETEIKLNAPKDESLSSAISEEEKMTEEDMAYENSQKPSGLSLIMTEGPVRILETGSPFPKSPGELPRVLNTGDKVQTQRNARAFILSADSEVILDADSIFNVLEADSAQLESGVALFEITARDGRRITAQTPLVVIGVKGTNFLVSSNEKREDVALFKGHVGIERQDRQAMAHYTAKKPGEMTFSEYAAFQKKSFGDYRKMLLQDFSDYKATMAAEFQAFKEEIDLRPGKKLTIGAGEKPEAVEAEVDKETQEKARSLQQWKKRSESSLKQTQEKE